MKKLKYFLLMFLYFNVNAGADTFQPFHSREHSNQQLPLHGPKLTFENKHYGACFMVPLSGKEHLLRGMGPRGIGNLNLKSRSLGVPITLQNLDSIYSKSRTNLEKHGLGLFEIYSHKNEFIGIAGFINIVKTDDGVLPSLSCNFLVDLEDSGIDKDVIFTLTDYAFQISKCEKIIADAIQTSPLSKTFESLGYAKKIGDCQFSPKQVRYEMTRNVRVERGLRELTNLVRVDPTRFIPRVQHLPTEDMIRTKELWKYFGKGVQLCTGGSAIPFLTISDLNMTNLRDFHGYRTDSPTSTYITEKEIKRFLLEEGVIKTQHALDNLRGAFCLGSHEGFMRLARCIFDIDHNDGIFAPFGAYGFFIHGPAIMKPTPFNIHLVDINRESGEKIEFTRLEKAIDDHPTARTLVLEMKTMAGAIYSEEELSKIIKLCKEKNLFLVADITHHGMEFNDKCMFPDVAELCFRNNFHQFAILYTGSKVYGLERARVGFLLLSKHNKNTNLYEDYDRELSCVLGEVPNLPFEVMRSLFSTSLKARKRYKEKNTERLRFNMNLMLAYIEGIDSHQLDDDLRDDIRRELGPDYLSGIRGVKVIYKPLGGMHMKVDVSQLRDKYWANFRMFNSEIFSYALNKAYNISTLHAYDFMDPNGFSMRLSFMSKHDIHRGMRSMSNFIGLLTGKSTKNQFWPEVTDVSHIMKFQ